MGTDRTISPGAEIEERKPRPTNRTFTCDSIAIAPEMLPTIVKQGKTAIAAQIANSIAELLKGLESLLKDKRFVLMENKKVWCDREVSGLYPKFEYVELPVFDTRETHAAKYPGLDFEGFHFDTMTTGECRKTFDVNAGNPYLDANGSCRYFSRTVYHSCGRFNGYFLTRGTQGGASRVISSTGEGDWVHDSHVYTLVPIHRFKTSNAGRMSYGEALSFWLRAGLMPEKLTGSQKKVYRQLLDSYSVLEKYFELTGDTLAFQSESFQKDVARNKLQDAVFSCDFNDDRLVEDVLKGKKTYSVAVGLLRDNLLNCDYVRANLEPYDAKRLTDLNLGHWDLFEEASDGDAVLHLSKNEYFVVRPPQMDVRTNAVCAIDFGTKSTVVACRDQDERLLRVGAGDYGKAAELEDYENPTVIALRDIEAFGKAYRARDGRPFTAWEQMTVSHQAEDELKKAKNSSVYYSVFSELKQWANDKDRRMMLRDLKKGNLVELKPYAELQDGDFDPIEIYAYYLGLYINNMHRCIYLDYILSFPVTYSLEVRERIRASFERGLRKSLPPALLNDEELMRRFRVYAGASEPAAYAISALQQFGLEPQKDNEEVSYAVFDFGGGTTDYDFGIERIPKDHRRNFEIVRIGRGGGDPYLGGENILALLAYEVYKANIAQMRENRISFVLPPKGKSFAGAEMLVKDVTKASQQAHMNRKKLSDILRDIWEQKTGYQKKFEGKGNLSVALFPDEGKDGEDTVNVELSIDLEHLKKCIKETIRAGVADFFAEMIQAFGNLDSSTIHIFLAGNSCKSPVVKELFEEYMEIYENKVSNDILHATTKSKKTKGIFTLHLPLGMKEEKKEKSCVKDGNVSKRDAEMADEREAENKERLDMDTVRTGKTGVVFGLLRSRKGGRDVKIVERDINEQKEIIFPYYMGDIDRDNHFHVRIGKDISYGEWVQFVPADEEEFELYYTKEARSLENIMSPHEVKMEKCLLMEQDVQENKYVYIRKVSPDTIEYAVGDEETKFDDNFEGKIYPQKLR